MTVYADYTYYTGTYLGESIASADFARLATKASWYIDKITFDRADSATDADEVDAIKMATCGVAEVLQTIAEEGDLGAVQSEKVGQYSVTYAQGSTRTQGTMERVIEVARLYLDQTSLMYAGFATDEYGTP